MPYLSAATWRIRRGIVSTMAGGADQHVAGDDNALDAARCRPPHYRAS
jgi:hypothetical protein